MAMETASWIWRNGEALADEYVDFLTHFPGSQSPILLRVAADSNYAAFVNGRLAAFGQYADYPQYKVYDQVDITPFVQPGENRLAIQVWYYGEDSQTYLLGKAGLIFQVESEGKLLAQSGEGTLSRISPDYHQGYRMPISMQLGFSYHYNLRAQDHWEKPGVEASGFAPSRVVPDISKQLHLRPIQKLRLEAPVEAHPVQQGSFFYTQQGQAAVNMQSAALCFGSWRQVTGKPGAHPSRRALRPGRGWGLCDSGHGAGAGGSVGSGLLRSLRLPGGDWLWRASGRRPLPHRGTELCHGAGRQSRRKPLPQSLPEAGGALFAAVFPLPPGHSPQSHPAPYSFTPPGSPLPGPQPPAPGDLRHLRAHPRLCMHEHYEDAPGGSRPSTAWTAATRCSAVTTPLERPLFHGPA